MNLIKYYIMLVAAVLPLVGLALVVIVSLCRISMILKQYKTEKTAREEKVAEETSQREQERIKRCATYCWLRYTMLNARRGKSVNTDQMDLQ